MAENYDSQVFNMGLAFLQHLYLHIVNASEKSFEGDLEGWFKILQSLHRKIIPFIKEKENEEVKKMINKIDWGNYNHFKNSKNSLLAQTERAEIYPQLCELEEKLMLLLKKYDMLMPKPSDPRFIFGK